MGMMTFPVSKGRLCHLLLENMPACRLEAITLCKVAQRLGRTCECTDGLQSNTCPGLSASAGASCLSSDSTGQTSAGAAAAAFTAKLLLRKECSFLVLSEPLTAPFELSKTLTSQGAKLLSEGQVSSRDSSTCTCKLESKLRQQACAQQCCCILTLGQHTC